MKLGVMQPYLFPYLGYFDLINYSDRWVVFDPVQYIERGWMNRNRILHPNEGWQYFTIPLKKHNRSIKISHVEMSELACWEQRLIGQLNHYKKRAPYFFEVKSLLQTCLGTRERLLARFNIRCLEAVCDYLEIPFSYEYLSEMNLSLGPVKAAGDWALRVSEAMGADEYVNPPVEKIFFHAKSLLDLEFTLRFATFHQCNIHVGVISIFRIFRF